MNNILDRLAGYLSPQWGMARLRARAKSAAVANALQHYEGATVSRRSSGWRTVSTDANATTLGQASRLRDVARDMVRNNPHAARARQVIAHNVVGNGIIPSAASSVDRAREELERLLKAHLDTTACDVDGRHNVYGLQALAMGTVVEAGEVLVRLRPRRREDGLPLPFQLQVMEPDHLDATVSGPQSNGNHAVQGVEFDPVGRRVAYHLFAAHPGAMAQYSRLSSRPVPADMVAHIYRSDRPGQARGVSWFAPVVLRLRDFADFADAQLMRQKIAACFAVFIKTADAPMHLAGQHQADSPYPLEALEPGIIERLREGEEPTFGQPPQVSGYAEYMSATLHEIAAGMGVSYEALTGDLAGVNFSSGRMGWLEFQRSIEAWRNHMLIPQLCERIGEWVLDAAGRTGVRFPARIIWTAPRREMISPAQEVPAIRAAIRSGLTSRSEEQRKLGFDPDDLDREIAEDNERADSKGLIFDSDPRRTSGAGLTQVRLPSNVYPSPDDDLDDI